MGLKSERLKLVGVDCPSCIYAIDRSLRSLEGLVSFKGDTATGDAVVVYDKSKLSLRDVVKAVRNVGYDIHLEKIHLLLELSEEEIPQFEKRIVELDGVAECRVSLVDGTAVVLYNPYTTSREAILGYIKREYPEAQEISEDIKELEQARVGSELSLKLASFLIGLTVILHHTVGILGIRPPFWDFKDHLYLAAATVVIVLNTDILARGFRSLIRGTPVMESLVSLSAVLAYIFSLAALLGLTNSGGTFFESSAGVLGFVSAGKYLEERIRARAAISIKHIAELQVSKARVVRDGNVVEEVPVEEVKPGDIVEVKAGERVPVDGVVVEGWGYLDESTFTGEPVPKFRSSDTRDPVLAGALLTSGFLRIRATRVGKETNLAYIIRTVREAQFYKPSYQRLADRVVGIFTWIVIAVSLATFTYWALVERISLETSILFSVAVLAASCPCPLGIAVPLVVWIASLKSSRLGLLVRRGDVFERALKVNVAVLDKTGTLTVGQPLVHDIEVLNGGNVRELLEYVCAAESRSEHPLARAIARYCEEHGVGSKEVESYVQLPGLGILSRVDGVEVAVGSVKLAEELGVLLSEELTSKVLERASKGHTIVLVLLDRTPTALIQIGDSIKPEARNFVRFLRSIGVKTILASGDSYPSAKAVAKELEIDEVYAEMRPEDKARLVEDLAKNGSKVMFVGDGVNDAPAIGRAFLGVAMGRGADISKEAGDVVVLSSIESLENLFRLAKVARRKALENLMWAFIYNVILIPVAAGALYGVLGLALRPEMAATAMVLSDISVVLNSISLIRWKPST